LYKYTLGKKVVTFPTIRLCKITLDVAQNAAQKLCVK